MEDSAFANEGLRTVGGGLVLTTGEAGDLRRLFNQEVISGLRTTRPRPRNRLCADMIKFADDAHMRRLEPLAEEFYDNVLRPDEEPGFVSDDASLLDISLAPENQLISKIKSHYGKTVAGSDLRKSFWLLLSELNGGRNIE